MFDTLIQKLLQNLPAETAHNTAIRLLNSPFAKLSGHKCINNPVDILGMRFPNPVGLAAGFDKNGQAVNGLSRQGFGFIEVGTVTPRPQPGNPKPRIFRLTKQQAIINRLGFNNHGVDYLVKQIEKQKHSGILGVNIGKNKNTSNEKALNDYVFCFNKVHHIADYITINISSPNTPGLRQLQNPHELTKLLKGIYNAQQECADKNGAITPVLVKIAPDQTIEQIRYLAESIIENGMNGIICTNTTTSRDGLTNNTKHRLETGGLSGRPLLDLSNQTLKAVRQTAGNDLCIIAVGGITDSESAMQKLSMGANLIQLYTGFVYHGHRLVKDINDRIKNANIT